MISAPNILSLLFHHWKQQNQTLLPYIHKNEEL